MSIFLRHDCKNTLPWAKKVNSLTFEEDKVTCKALMGELESRTKAGNCKTGEIS